MVKRNAVGVARRDAAVGADIGTNGEVPDRGVPRAVKDDLVCRGE